MIIIKKYPFVKQQGLKECGPVCVQMILKYYHGYASIDKLSEMMQTNSSGTTAYNLVKTLNNIGFESKGLKYLNLDKINIPCIAHVIINSYNHYIVIYEINFKKEYIIIADPASYIKKLSFKEFKKMWSGVVIEMKPNDKIICDYEPKVFKFIWHYIKSNIKLIILVSLLSLVVNILSIATSLFLPLIIKEGYSKLNIIFKYFIIIYILKLIITFFQNKSLITLNKNLNNNISNDIFKNVLSLPYRYYKRRTTGEITCYFSQLNLVINFILIMAQTLLIDLPLLLIIFLILLVSNKIIFLINIVSILLIIMLIKTCNNRKYVQVSENLRKKSYLNSFMVESISNFETIKNLNIENKINKKFNRINNDLINQTYKLNSIYIKQTLLKDILYGINLLLIILCSINIYHTDISIFISQFVLSTILISTFKNIIDLDLEYKETIEALKKLAELTIKKSENILECDGNINIKNLFFKYDTNQILKNINLNIKQGNKVFITGTSGSGKSSLAKILKGYYNYEGSIKIGNKEVNGRVNDIIYISQMEKLFLGTLEDNLKIKTGRLPKKDICNIDNILKTNYHKIIEEEGFNLSGGQRQRIILTRALSDFKILIIDEGLSQVSSNMERIILKNLIKEYKNKTIIYISHRLDNLDLFNQYIKISNGKIVNNEKRNN